MLNFPQGALRTMQAIIQSSTDWAGALVGLFVNNLVPGPSTILSSITEVTQAGYASVAATWDAIPLQDFDGDPLALNDAVVAYKPSSVGTPQTIFGAYLTDAARTKLLAAARFPSQYTWTALSNKFQVLLSFGLTMSSAKARFAGDGLNGAMQQVWGYLVLSGKATVEHS